MVVISCGRGALLVLSLGSGLYALSYGGPVAIVYTVTAMYILIPIVLAIIFYNEHWNTQKVIAIIISVAALALLG